MLSAGNAVSFEGGFRCKKCAGGVVGGATSAAGAATSSAAATSHTTEAQQKLEKLAVADTPAPSAAGLAAGPAAPAAAPAPAAAASPAPAAPAAAPAAAAAAPVAAAAYPEGVQAFFAYETLRLPKSELPAGVDYHTREQYLADDEFAKIFGMDKAAFAKLPNWRKKQKKQKAGLF